MADGIGIQLNWSSHLPSRMISGTILCIIELSHAKEIYVYGIHYAHPLLHAQIEHSFLVRLSCCLYGLFIGKSSLKKGQAGSEGKHGYH